MLARLAGHRNRPLLFTTFLALRFLQYVGAWSIDASTDRYRQFWYLSEAIGLALLTLAVVECHLMITREIYELGSIGKAVALVAVGLALGVAVTTGGDSSVQWSARLALAIQVKRALLTFLTVALVTVVWFYGRFPIPVASHVWPHTWVFIAYLAFHSVGYWGIAVLGKKNAPDLDRILTWIWCGCLAAWLWIYSRPSDRKMPPSEEKLNEANRRAGQMERTVGQ